MDKNKLLEYCYENEDCYINNSERIEEGQEQFACLILLIEAGDITSIEQLHEYGM